MRRGVGPRSGAAVAAAIALVVLVGALVDSDRAAELRRRAADADRDRARASSWRAARARLARRELGVLLAVGRPSSRADDRRGRRGQHRRLLRARRRRRCSCLGRSVPRRRRQRAARGADRRARAARATCSTCPSCGAGSSSPLTPMALPTALAMLALSAGADRREPGARRCSRAAAGRAARCCAGSRRAAIVLPVALAFVDARRRCATTGSTSARGWRCSAPR